MKNQLKTMVVCAILCAQTSILSAQIKVETNGDVAFGSSDFHGKLYYDSKGRYGSTSSHDFDTKEDGIILEQGKNESSGIYLDGEYAVIWSPGDQERLLRVYDEDGMVEKWYLDGNGNAHTVSDERKKENITDLGNSTLNSLMDVRTVKYNYKQTAEEKQKITKTAISTRNGTSTDSKKKENNSYYGFLAQDLEKSFPELVSTNEKGQKFVNYNGMLPLLLNALKEQQKMLKSQEERIKDLEFMVGEMDELGEY